MLRTHLKDSLPSYMLPAQIHVIDALPLNANGNLDRRALAAADVATVKRAYEPPRSAAERGVADIWRQMLGVEQVGLHDNFFELGGHSLLATQVASRIERDLGVKLSLRTLFEAQNLAGLAAAVEAANADGLASDRLSDAVLDALESLQGLSDEELERLAGATS
jgi:acyl carrier protein